MIIYSSKYLVGDIQGQLQKALDYVEDYLNKWRIEMNVAKCEAILFRSPLRNANRDLKRNWKKLKVTVYNQQPITLKESVKYLGINIDNMCYMADHTTIQLKKARNAFMAAKRIFYSKHIGQRVKTIAYKALIRPILTYGCAVWYNQVPRYIERMRVFERKCLRHCHGKFRKPETDYLHYVSNKTHYENYDGDRIDVHMIKLTRDHILRACQNTNNSLIYGPYHIDVQLAKHYMSDKMVPGPNIFTHLDRNGYVQNKEGIPLIYHVQRRPNEKWFEADKFINSIEHLRFNTDMSVQSADEYEVRCHKYWWLEEEEEEER